MPDTVAQSTPIHVVAGVLRDPAGRVLLAQRPPGKDLAGHWEFPGGKVEVGESPAAALTRELGEELGIRAIPGRRRIRVPHGRIVLDVYDIARFDGIPQSREGQSLIWLDPAEVDRRHLPEADRPVLTSLSLPDRYLVTPVPSESDESAFVASLEAAIEDGISLVQLRLPGWSRERVLPLARLLRECCARHGVRLLLNADWKLALVLGFDGVHLPARTAAALRDRPIPRDRLLGVSCHDAEELAHAMRIGADFATLSPVLATQSHVDVPALGWETAAQLIAYATIPVFALGGLVPNNREIAFRHGFQGIAAIRSLWRSR